MKPIPQLDLSLPAQVPSDHGSAVADVMACWQHANPTRDPSTDRDWLTLEGLLHTFCVRLTSSSDQSRGVGRMPCGVTEILIVARAYSKKPDFWKENTYDRKFLAGFFRRYLPGNADRSETVVDDHTAVEAESSDVDESSPDAEVADVPASFAIPSAPFRYIRDNPCLAYHYLLYCYRENFLVLIGKASLVVLSAGARALAIGLAEMCFKTMKQTYNWLIKEAGAPAWNAGPGEPQDKFGRYESELRTAWRRILMLAEDGTGQSAFLPKFAAWAKKKIDSAALSLPTEEYFGGLLAELGSLPDSPARMQNLRVLVLALHGTVIRSKKAGTLSDPTLTPAEIDRLIRKQRQQVADRSRQIHSPTTFRKLLKSAGLDDDDDDFLPGGDDTDPANKKADGLDDDDDDDNDDDDEDDDDDDDDDEKGPDDIVELEEEHGSVETDVYIPYHSSRQGRSATVSKVPLAWARDSIPLPMVAALKEVLPVPARAQLEITEFTGLQLDFVRCLMFWPVDQPVPDEGLYISPIPGRHMIQMRYFVTDKSNAEKYRGYLPLAREFSCPLVLSEPCMELLWGRATAQDWREAVFDVRDMIVWKDYLSKIGCYPQIKGRLEAKLRNTATRSLQILGVHDEVLAPATVMRYMPHKNSSGYTWESLYDVADDLLSAAEMRLKATSGPESPDLIRLQSYRREHLRDDFPETLGFGSSMALPPETIDCMFIEAYRAGYQRIIDIGRGARLVNGDGVRKVYRRLRVALRAAAEVAVGARDHAEEDVLHIFSLGPEIGVWIADKETRRGLEQRIGVGFVWLRKLLDLVAEYRVISKDYLSDADSPMTLEEYNRELFAMLGIAMPRRRRVNIIRHTVKTALRHLPSQLSQNTIGHMFPAYAQMQIMGVTPPQYDVDRVAQELNKHFPFPGEWLSL